METTLRFQGKQLWDDVWAEHTSQRSQARAPQAEWATAAEPQGGHQHYRGDVTTSWSHIRKDRTETRQERGVLLGGEKAPESQAEWTKPGSTRSLGPLRSGPGSTSPPWRRWGEGREVSTAYIFHPLIPTLRANKQISQAWARNKLGWLLEWTLLEAEKRWIHSNPSPSTPQLWAE